MATIPFINPENKNDIIEYLLRHKFPKGMGEASIYVSPNPFLLKEVDKYRSELNAKTLEELKNLYDELEFQKREEWRLKTEKEEEQRFYNQPWANANLNHWGSLDYWTLDESIALSFGKEPKHVNWKKIEPLLPNNIFARKYEQLRDRCLRARDTGILYDKMSPETFVQWIKQKNISFPIQLEEIVLKGQVKTINWEKEYKELEEICKKNKVIYEETVGQFLNDSEAKKTVIAELQDKLSQTFKEGKNFNQINPPHESQTKRKLNNILMIFYYLVKSRFGYDPQDARATATKIYNLLWEKEGVKVVTVDVITGYLEQSFEKIQDN